MENFILITVFVLLGMGLRWIPAFPPESSLVLNMFALYVSLPAVILLQVPHLAFSREMLTAAVIPWLMLLLSAALVLLAARTRGWSRGATGVLLLVVPIGNTSFLGVPMVQAFFGAPGLPYLVIYDQFGTMVIFATYGALILALYGKEGPVDLPAVARRALLFPPTVAFALGLILSLWPYPAALTTVLQSLAVTLTPLVMTAIGLQLSLRLRRTVLAPLGFGLATKLVAAPLTALLICRFLGLHGLAADIPIFEAGMPPMVTAGALAIAAGLEPELAAALVGLGIIGAFATLPLLYLLLQLWT